MIAKKVVAAHAERDEWNGYKKIAKQHKVRYVADGLDRVAFLWQDRIYKFAKSQNSQQQQEEIRQYEVMRAMMETNPEAFDGWGLPEMRMFRAGEYIVIEAEYLGDEMPYNLPYDNPWGAGDAHSGNVRERDGKFYLIDLGYAHVAE